METNFEKYNETKDSRWYKGFELKRNPERNPGDDGYWIVPELYYRNFANKIEKGFETVSIIQCKEAIDKWFEFNLKIKNFKDDNEV